MFHVLMVVKLPEKKSQVGVIHAIHFINIYLINIYLLFIFGWVTKEACPKGKPQHLHSDTLQLLQGDPNTFSGQRG